MTNRATEVAIDPAVAVAGGDRASISARSPSYLALRRRRRNYVAVGACGVFVAIAILSAAAPLYAAHVAHTGPNDTHVTDVVRVGGHSRQVIAGGGFEIGPGGVPKLKQVSVLGPTWWHAGGRFVLGADQLGRDV